MTTCPDWLAAAHRIARGFTATTMGARGGRHSVYAILLHDPRVLGSGGLGRWGLYVGQTAREPDVRFDQHKAGYKASSAVRRFGVRLLPALTAHLNPLREWESRALEAGLAEAFRRGGIAWVEGGH